MKTFSKFKSYFPTQVWNGTHFMGSFSFRTVYLRL